MAVASAKRVDSLGRGAALRGSEVRVASAVRAGSAVRLASAPRAGSAARASAGAAARTAALPAWAIAAVTVVAVGIGAAEACAAPQWTQKRVPG
jgi:hypothetical protein